LTSLSYETEMDLHAGQYGLWNRTTTNLSASERTWASNSAGDSTAIVCVGAGCCRRRRRLGLADFGRTESTDRALPLLLLPELFGDGTEF